MWINRSGRGESSLRAIGRGVPQANVAALLSLTASLKCYYVLEAEQA